MLQARDEDELRHLQFLAHSGSLPHALFTDEREDGTPWFTCLGLGPCTREAAAPITEGLKLMP